MDVHDLLLGHWYGNLDELIIILRRDSHDLAAVAILLGNVGNAHDPLMGHWYRNLDELIIILLRSALLGSDLRYLQDDNGWNRILTAWNSERRS